MAKPNFGGVIGSMQSCLMLAMLLLAGCQNPKPPVVEHPPVLPTATTLLAPVRVNVETPILLIYRDSLNSPVPPRDQVQVAVWGDGKIVWRIGKSMMQGRVAVEKIDALLMKLHEDGVFGDGHAYQAEIGPDAAFEAIEVRLFDRLLKMVSWHERFAQNPRLIVTAHGVESLDGRDPQAVMADQPEPYQRFRRIWAEIRAAVKSWEPTSGEPYDGIIIVGP